MKPDLMAFATRVLDASNYGDLDGGDLQQIAVDCGVLVEVEVTEPCGEECVCADAGLPTTCYRRVPLVDQSLHGWDAQPTAIRDEHGQLVDDPLERGE